MRVRFHTARADVAKVTVLYGDPYWQLPDADGTNKLIYQRRSMHLIGHGKLGITGGDTRSSLSPPAIFI